MTEVVDKSEEIAKAILHIVGFDLHEAVSNASIALGTLTATMIRLSTTPDADPEPALAGIDAAIRATLRAVGFECGGPTQEEIVAKYAPEEMHS